MSEVIQTLPKPALGSPCNGCGMCCIAEPCLFAREFIGVQEGRCPALEHEGGRFWCGLIRNAHKHIPGLEGKPWGNDLIRDALLSSGGWNGVCDSDDPEEPNP